jgi:hypothetical protein
MRSVQSAGSSGGVELEQNSKEKQVHTPISFYDLPAGYEYTKIEDFAQLYRRPQAISVVGWLLMDGL